MDICMDIKEDKPQRRNNNVTCICGLYGIYMYQVN